MLLTRLKFVLRAATENVIEKPNNTLLDLGIEPKTSSVAVVLKTTRLTTQLNGNGLQK